MNEALSNTLTLSIFLTWFIPLIAAFFTDIDFFGKVGVFIIGTMAMVALMVCLWMPLLAVSCLFLL